MCSIMYVKNLVDSGRVNDLCRVLYEGQKHRGSDAFGVVAFSAEEYYVDKWLSEGDFILALSEMKYSEMLIHTRYPTSTENVIESAHPFVVERGGSRYYFIHNGVIGNAVELREKHLASGVDVSSVYPYVSYDVVSGKFNDSEALAYEVVDFIAGGCVGAVSARGSVAMICLEQEIATGRAVGVYYYRNDYNPMTMLRTSGTFALASEGLGEKVESGKLFKFSYSDYNVSTLCELEIKSGYTYEGFGVSGSVYGYMKSGVGSGGAWEDVDDYGVYGSGVGSGVDVGEITSYEEAVGAIEELAMDYNSWIADVRSGVADMGAVGSYLAEIWEEIAEIMELYAIPYSHLSALGIELESVEGGKQLELEMCEGVF